MVQPTEVQLTKLHRVLTVRTYAFKAVAFGVVVFFAGPLSVFLAKPIGDWSDLGFVLSVLGTVVGVVGALALFTIHIVADCPFCKKSFYNPYWWGSIFGKSCFRCGRGMNRENPSVD